MLETTRTELHKCTCTVGPTVLYVTVVLRLRPVGRYESHRFLTQGLHYVYFLYWVGISRRTLQVVSFSEDDPLNGSGGP